MASPIIPSRIVRPPVAGVKRRLKAGNRDNWAVVVKYKILYMPPLMNDAAKAIQFCGGALDDLRAFPSSARRDAGYELDKVQNGRDPGDWKPMNTVGAGVREIRIRDARGAFRVLYVAKFA